MKPGLLSTLLALTPLPAVADGPALAHLTLDGVTLTLTRVETPLRAATIPAPETGTAQTLVFAQMHLGFPTPPELLLVVRTPPDIAPFEEGADIFLHHLSLNALPDGRNGTGAGTHLGSATSIFFDAETGQIRDREGTGDRTAFRIVVDGFTGDALGQMVPTTAEIAVQLHSP